MHVHAQKVLFSLQDCCTGGRNIIWCWTLPAFLLAPLTSWKCSFFNGTLALACRKKLQDQKKISNTIFLYLFLEVLGKEIFVFVLPLGMGIVFVLGGQQVRVLRVHVAHWDWGCWKMGDRHTVKL